MPTPPDQVRPTVPGPPPRAAEELAADDSTAIPGAVRGAVVDQGPAAIGTKWQRLAERLRNKPACDDPQLEAAWKQFREDVRDVHENFLAR